MRICLNMIVRDEAANLPRLFDSLVGVADCFVISDTGSRDGTPALLEALSERHGIPGRVTSHAWVDFATNRNLALGDALDARAKGEMDFDWILVMDADEEMKLGTPDWRSRLSPGASHLAYKRAKDISWQHDLLLWVDGQSWRWEGPIHSHVRNADRDHVFVHTNDLAVVYHEFQGAKSRPFSDGKAKAQADASLLTEELLGRSPSGSDVHRFFQLGHAHRKTGNAAACMATMRAVAESPHAGRQLAYAALVNAGHCLTEAGRPVGEALKEYRDAMQLDPLRWEAPFHIAIRLLAGRDPECARALLEDRIRMGYADEGLYWKEHDVYEWRLAYELCLLRAVTGSADEAERLGESLLKADRLPLMESGFIRKLLERLESRKPDPSTDLDVMFQPGPP
jgi:hypothetical protein